MDFLKLRRVSNPRISPDGKRIVYEKRQVDVHKDRWEGELWIMECGRGRRIAVIVLVFFVTAPGVRSESSLNSKLFGAEIFVPGVISTANYERGGTFTPDNKTFYFTMRSPEGYFTAICVSSYKNGKWGSPEIAPFSGRYVDQDPIISPDGSKLFFASRRPVDGKPRGDTDIWFVRRTSGAWSEPENLGAPVNSPADEGYATVTDGGTFYFHSSREGGKGGWDIYRARLVDGAYATPENLGDAINTEAAEVQPFVAPDESYLIFVSADRLDEIVGDGNRYPRGDLYVSLRQKGVWTRAKHLGPAVNTAAAEACPFISPDGRYFFFTSERGFMTTLPRTRPSSQQLTSGLRRMLNGLGNIYWIDSRLLQLNK